MNDLKAIHVEGKMVLIFDNDVTLSMEETKETSVENNSNLGFQRFLWDLFETEHMTAEEQEKILHMTVQEFCGYLDNLLAHQGGEEEGPIPLGIPKLQFLSNLSMYACPKCKQKGFKLIDGHLHCTCCAFDFGDVDNLQETLIR